MWQGFIPQLPWELRQIPAFLLSYLLGRPALEPAPLLGGRGRSVWKKSQALGEEGIGLAPLLFTTHSLK